jgi:hypothetical protein
MSVPTSTASVTDVFWYFLASVRRQRDSRLHPSKKQSRIHRASLNRTRLKACNPISPHSSLSDVTDENSQRRLAEILQLFNFQMALFQWSDVLKLPSIEKHTT